MAPPAPTPTSASSRPTGRAPIARLAWMLARPGAASPATVALPIVAFAVTTALLLIVLGGVLMFWQRTDENAPAFQMLSLLAIALLIVPLATLGGAAARLSARRRDDRLATLRLLGATTGTVTLVTVVESTALAFLGAIAGVVLYLVSMPLVGLIPFGGGPIGPTAIWTGPLAILGVVVGVALLAAVSSVVGLRAVVVSPLGVRLKQRAPHTSWVRLLVGAIIVAVAYATLSSLGVITDVAILVGALVGAFAASVAVLGLVGPFALSIFAKVRLRRAKTAEQLISARGILESPKAAWRLVGGVAMTSFVAVVAGTGTALLESFSAHSTSEALFIADIRTGVLITLVASFVMVACSVGVGQAAAVLDRRDLYVSLDRVGMPVSTMDTARVRSVMLPLLFVAIGSALLGALLVFPLAGLTLIMAPLSLLVIAICFVLGLALVRLSLLATRPILTNVLAHPERSLG
ncbi:FtsX-like permease family protein [Labedella phragmitis]|uniref:FtsX-like permease family protein n=1 Tax=Labedella phragmitis TaxID=2498849 RepID=A0A444PZ26_9MICO|nr:FtsX-like permease family protein [Labedella phragmitis]RWZ53128.1 FtsX-like permease family protein [Labedella phragmitis]